MTPSLTAEQREWVEANMGVAGSVASRFHHRARDESTYDDIRSIAYLGLCHASRAFDRDRGFAFTTYAAKCCRNAIIRELRNGGVIRTGKKVEARNRIRGATIESNALDSCIESHPAADPVREAERRELHDRIALLPTHERWAIERSLEGWNGVEMGRAIGRTNARINQILIAARQRLKESYVMTIGERTEKTASHQIP